ncbi:putative cell division protein [Nostocoides australiense Ben110]|uniref:Cell division protein FtsX n=1 Tax=Nostocoides australiense Ben110 TaxID=1193182 RepID=W6K1G7_9MICO|nr:permease-like cell division protein FtsX [Tetrasphaera australiensis]CCH72129.1 putative cell division protein [Tetrasphaera australiensis Ben110]
MRLRYLFGDVWVGLRRNMSMAISVILVTMISLFLLGLGLLAQRQADVMKGYWYDRVQVSIFLCSNKSTQGNCLGHAVTEDQKANIRSQLGDLRPLVKEVFYESPQEAYDRFREQFKDTPLAGNIKVGDIPQSYRVQLSDPAKYEVVASTFENAPGVSMVQDQKKVLDKLFAILNKFTQYAVGLAVIMVICAVLLMATTIRQAAFSRRREIGIMRLVGASNMAIRLPFILETVIAALVGAGLALGLLTIGVRALVGDSGSQLAQALNQATIGLSDVWRLAPILGGTAAALAIVTATITLWRYLRV